MSIRTFSNILFNPSFLFLLLILGCEADQDGLPPHIKALDNVILLTDQQNSDISFELKKDIVFRDSLHLDKITDLLVDDNGRVYIAGEGWNRRQVHIFDSNGNYADSLGNYGTDLGEFMEISRMQLIDDVLFLLDEKLKRITSYSLQAESWIDTLEVNSTGFLSDKFVLNNFEPSPAAILNDETYVHAFRKIRNPAYEPSGTIQYYKSDASGKLSENKLFEQKDLRYLIGDYAGRPAPFILQFPERPIFEISENGKLLSAHTEEFLIRIYSSNGNYLRSYYYPYERRKLDPHEVIHPKFSHNDQILRIRESADYPEYWPALYSVVIDNSDRIWVSTIIDDRNLLEWWVIDDQTGTLLTRFRWPVDQPIHRVINESVYTVEKNSMGFSEVVRYKMKSS